MGGLIMGVKLEHRSSPGHMVLPEDGNQLCENLRIKPRHPPNDTARPGEPRKV